MSEGNDINLRSLELEKDSESSWPNVYRMKASEIEKFPEAMERLKPLFFKYPQAKGFLATQSQGQEILRLPPLSGQTDRGLKIHPDEMTRAEKATNDLIANLKPYY